MTSGIELLAAALPLLIAGGLVVGLLWPATRAMPIAWISALAIGYLVWNMPPAWLGAASVVGVMTALQILWIVFGALVLLYTLMQAGAFDRINRGFAAVSDDRRVQIVLLGFFLATFIEGAAGFGTPAAVVAPLLLGLGFPALAAVIAALIGHIIAVTYGAVGTPIIESTQLAIEAGGYSVPEYAQLVATWAATYHTIAGVVMPLFAVAMVVYFFGDREERSLQPAWEAAPLALFAGVAFVIPYLLAATFLGGEFPSLIGAMVGWSPYVALVVLLVVTRVVDDVVAFLQQDLFITQWAGILGTDLAGSISWAYVPGFWLVVSALIAIPLFGMSREQVTAAWGEAAEKLVAPLIALVFVIAMVQVMLQSGAHPGAPEAGSMIQALATFTADSLGPAYPLIAALIGALGAAMAGSNTVSNITFGGFQFEAATALALPTQLVVGAQAVGGAIGNLIAIHNVVAALATVGLVGQEGRVMRLNLIPLVYYSAVVGILAMLFSYLLFPGLF
jgi:lactate permease